MLGWAWVGSQQRGARRHGPSHPACCVCQLSTAPFNPSWSGCCDDMGDVRSPIPTHACCSSAFLLTPSTSFFRFKMRMESIWSSQKPITEEKAARQARRSLRLGAAAHAGHVVHGLDATYLPWGISYCRPARHPSLGAAAKGGRAWDRRLEHPQPGRPRLACPPYRAKAAGARRSTSLQ